MGNMDPYISLSVMAKKAGGPEALIRSLDAKGATKGSIITAAVILTLYGASKGIGFVKKKYRDQKDAELAAATADVIEKAKERRTFTAKTECSLPGGLTIAPGARFRALTRDDDVIMIEVEGRSDNPFFVSGAQLEQISDFTLEEIDPV